MLRKNIFFNYISQAYVTVIGVLILPLYIKYMGEEAYGLIGFFTLLQAWFGLLDLGLSPTISRETARYRSGVLEALAFRKLYRSLSLIFIAVAIFGSLGLLSASEIISSKWLSFETLDESSVILALQVMAVSVALRWMGGLYRGVIVGSELIVWLSLFNIGIATIRFVGVFVSMWFFGFDVLVFFIHQLLVVILETTCLFLKSRATLPDLKGISETIGWSFKPVIPILKFALTIAFTSSIWIFTTQTDKLILSGILPLAEYGFFTLAVLVASTILVTSGPVSNSLMPRMVKLWSEGHVDELLKVYRQSTQVVTIISGTVALTFVFAAQPMLLAWTGDDEIAAKAGPILQLYAAGNLFLVLSAFPYYMQYAIGNLKYHFIGNVIVFIVLIPSIIFAASTYGSIGAAWVWLSLNTFMFFIWVWFVHAKLFPGLHIEWFKNDILLVLLPALLFCIVVNILPTFYYGRLGAFIFSCSLGGICLFSSILFSPLARNYLKSRVKK